MKEKEEATPCLSSVNTIGYMRILDPLFSAFLNKHYTSGVLVALILRSGTQKILIMKIK